MIAAGWGEQGKSGVTASRSKVVLGDKSVLQLTVVMFAQLCELSVLLISAALRLQQCLMQGRCLESIVE